MKRVALYFRVSTDDQTTEPQRLELLAYCERQGWKNPETYADKISGAKFTRLGLDRLMADVRAGRIETVVCVKLDRLGRSLPHLLQMIAEFDKHGVGLVCTSQPVDTSNQNPMGKMTMGILMVFAEFERDIIRERTRAGLAAARDRGAVFGRPAIALTEDQEKLVAEHTGGVRQLAKALGCSVGKAQALVKAQKARQPA